MHIGGGDRLEIGYFRNFQTSVTLTMTLVVALLSGNVLISINVVTLRRARNRENFVEGRTLRLVGLTHLHYTNTSALSSRLFQGEYKTVRRVRPRVEARSNERERGLERGCPPSQVWGSGVVTPGTF